MRKGTVGPALATRKRVPHAHGKHLTGPERVTERKGGGVVGNDSHRHDGFKWEQKGPTSTTAASGRKTGLLSLEVALSPGPGIGSQLTMPNYILCNAERAGRGGGYRAGSSSSSTKTSVAKNTGESGTTQKEHLVTTAGRQVFLSIIRVKINHRLPQQQSDLTFGHHTPTETKRTTKTAAHELAHRSWVAIQRKHIKWGCTPRANGTRR